MNGIITDYNNHPKINVDLKANNSLTLGDIIACTFTSVDDGKAVFTMADGKSFKTPAENIVGEVGQSLNFKVIDSQGNSVVMKQILEEEPQEYHGESADLSGDELLNWTKGAVLPITGAAFRSSKIRFEANAEQDLKLMEALNRITRDIKYSIKNVSTSALSLLASNGISVNKVSITMLSQAINSAVKGVSAEPTEDEIISALEQFSKNDNSQLYQQSFNSVKALLSEDLPLTETSVSQLNSVQQKVSEILNMDVKDKINYLLTDSEPTIGNLFTAIHSGVANKGRDAKNTSGWIDMLNGVKKYMERENIQVTNENLNAAKLLIENDIPVTKRNLDFINNKAEPASIDDILERSAANISKGASPLNVHIFKDEISAGINGRELLSSYNDIIKALPTITDRAIEMSLDANEPVTIRNIINNQQNMDDYNRQGRGSQGRNNERLLAERILLEEIRLRLSLSSAAQMSKLGISIDGLELQDAIDELKALERNNNSVALAIAGVEPSESNLEAMSQRSSIFKQLANTNDNVLRSVLHREIKFSAQEVHNAILRTREHAVIDSYKENETAVNAKFGDGFGKVAGQIESLLLSLGIDASEGNLKAAKSLVRTNTDVTKENIEAIKAINNKIQHVSQNLHPIIAAEMIKDRFNPLNAHIDEVIAYIDKFNEINGAPPLEAMEQAIFNMDSKNSLSADERDSLIAMYRMLSAINKNETAGSAIIAKSGKSLTLENLMESGKYYDKSKSRRGTIDKSVDDAQGITEAIISPNSIREQLNAAYRITLEELAGIGVTKTTAEQIAEDNGVGNTAQNMELIKAIIDNEINTRELNAVSNIRDNINRLIDAANDKNSIEFFKKLTIDDAEKTDIAKLIESMAEFMEKTATDDATLNMSESASFNVFKDDLMSLRNVSPQQIAWLQSLNLPLTVGHLKTAKEMANDDSYLGKKIHELNETAKHVVDDNLEVDGIIPEATDTLTVDNTADNIMERINDKIDNLIDKAMESDNPQRVSLYNQASLVRNAAALAEKSAKNNNHYHIPIKLHDKVSGLNIYYLNQSPDINNMNAFMRLNLSNLGTIEGSININNGFADIIIAAENENSGILLEKNSGILQKFIADLGFLDYKITFDNGDKRGESLAASKKADLDGTITPEENRDNSYSSKMDVLL